MVLTMVFAMTATAFATETITPQPVTYPMNVNVWFIAFGDEVTDVSGTVHQTTYVEEYPEISFESPFTTIFTQYLPSAPAAGAHQLNGYPTVMDAICKAYLQANGSMSGFSIGWDSNPSEGPQGAYVNTLFNNSTITTVLGDYRWEGYSWNIYLNSTANTWNAATRTGKIPYYASNVQVKSGDTIYVMYEDNEETW